MGKPYYKSKAEQATIKEGVIIKEILLLAPQYNSILFRNTVGVFQTKVGSMIKTGLCTGSSDLIGVTSIMIRGNPLGVFTAIEVKAGKTRTTKEQLNFIRVVNDAGGIAMIVYSAKEYAVLMGEVIRRFER
jgi:hypothetical protein